MTDDTVIDAAAPTTPAARVHADQLADAVRRAGPVVGLDVFDTLVERVVRPEHVKILACERLAQRLGLETPGGPELYARRRRIEAALCRGTLAAYGESEFRHAEMATALHAELRAAGVAGDLPGVTAFADMALRAELSVERQVLRAKPGAIAALQAARATGRRVLLLSDFYLPGAAVAGLLAGLGIAPPLYEALHVSCDRGASKRSGRLFDLALAQAGCAPGDVTMLGDNAHSDVAMARSRGLDAVLVEDPARVGFYASADADVARAAALLDSLRGLVHAPDAPAAHLRHAAPALLLFVERLYRAARRRGLSHLFFLSREGQLLERLFNLHQDALGLDGPERIATHYVLASRRACYAASLAPLEEEGFEGLFAQYRRISLRDFLASLGIAGADTDRIAARLGRDPDAVEEDFPTGAALRALRGDAGFAALYEARRTAQRAALRDYLAGFGVDLRRHPLAVVDCGWKGSIQDFLRRALPAEIAVQGFYLGIVAVGQDVGSKQGLLFSNVGGPSPDYFVFAENRSLFEVLLCADHGTATGYARAADGRVVALLEDDPAERDFVARHAMPVARDVEAAFRRLAAARAMTVVPAATWEKAVAETHAQLVFRPWLPQAAWLAAARHRESFGVFHLSEMTARPRAGAAARLRFLAQLLRRPRATLAAAFWPAALLHAHGGRPLVRAYAAARRLRGRRFRRRAVDS